MKFPAKFSDEILDLFYEIIPDGSKVLDPFAGIGRIHELMHCETTGVEIEPEWAALHPGTRCANILRFRTSIKFDVIATSCTYGNRMADHHDAKDGSVRHTYKHYLGRDLHEDNSGQLQWGDEYRHFHELAWKRVVTFLKPKGLFILNISDHIRSGERQPVVQWHVQCLQRLGLIPTKWYLVPTRRLRHGENHDVRVEYEEVVVFRKNIRNRP